MLPDRRTNQREDAVKTTLNCQTKMAVCAFSSNSNKVCSILKKKWHIEEDVCFISSPGGKQHTKRLKGRYRKLPQILWWQTKLVQFFYLPKINSKELGLIKSSRLSCRLICILFKCQFVLSTSWNEESLLFSHRNQFVNRGTGLHNWINQFRYRQCCLGTEMGKKTKASRNFFLL